jgi:glycerophosphoryl diester phosphodiesterase
MMMTSRSAAWLTSFPIAHRGLHDFHKGIIENTLSAFRAAIQKGYAIECDVRMSADGEAMVFHDKTLERLTAHTGEVAHFSAHSLCQMAHKGSTDTLLTLESLLSEVRGHVPLFVEIKSECDEDMRLTKHVIERVRDYEGSVALMSFDPHCIAHVREHAPHVIRGIVGELARSLNNETLAHDCESHHSPLTIAHLQECAPDFIAWSARDFPCQLPLSWAHVEQKPLLAWTVRSPQEQALALSYADQVIFEGFTVKEE